ncbi:MAG: hypothetical protein IKU03_01925 [Bacteroidales bacterium]|nr:hypothetical protein [Bacteroidales bacterium]
MRAKRYLLLLALTALLCACHPSGPEAPKPMGYFRIDLPARTYSLVDTTLPFSFEQSDQAQLVIKPQSDGNCWIDIDYPDLNATLKLTCLKITSPDSLRNLIYSEERMVKFHYQKADDVEYSVVRDEDAHLWGQIYDIKGKEVATPFQFWLTDSTHHFIRATLYFNFAPNNDSLQPVIDYLREDAMHYINTFEWK